MKTFNTTSALAALAVASVLVTASGAALANDHNYNGVTENGTATYSQVVEQQTDTAGIRVNDHNYNGSTATVPAASQQRELSNAATPTHGKMNSHNYSGDATASNASAQYDDLSAANAATVQNTARKTAWF